VRVIQEASVSVEDERCWHATPAERATAELISSAPLDPRSVVRILLRSPRIVPDAVRLATSAAYTGMWSSTGLRALLNSERVLQAMPAVARGAAQWAPEEPFSSVLVSQLSGTVEALELGCGSGRISRLAAPHVGRLVCADVSDTMLRNTQNTLASCSNVEYVRLNGRDLAELPDGRFDVVYAHAVFYLFDLVQLLGMAEEVRRVLRPAGRSIISFRTIDDPVSAEQALHDARLVRSRGVGSGRFRPYTLDQLRKIFELAEMPLVDVQASEAGDPSHYLVLTGKK
jgi:SAM-dependent methyltransferase